MRKCIAEHFDLIASAFLSTDQSDGPTRIGHLLSQLGYSLDAISKVVAIVQNVSFRKELENCENGIAPPSHVLAELACVQDADRLDAIGAIGKLVFCLVCAA